MWKDFTKTKNVTIGCGVDTISKLIVFTREGKLLDRPYYLGHVNLVEPNKKPLEPLVQLHAKCDVLEGTFDLDLPPVKVTMNYGAQDFLWKGDLRELFGALHSKEKLFQPPILLKSQTLKTIGC